ncbi:MAG: PAS domain S-box protein, partial [Ignavibacteria bacterium]|nr:PAS domain S-box protein [Ignavibacteria bacterium]
LQLVATRAAAELERERSDRILRKREYEFRTLAENMPDNIVRYDRDGRTIYVNPVVEKTLRTGAAQMIGTTIRELNPDRSYETYAQAVDNALASGENSEMELSVPNPNNEQIVHQIRIIVERDEQNKVTSILAIGRDITERKRAEEALLRSEERYRLIAENTADTISVLELDLTPIYISPSVFKMRGITVDEALSLSMDQILTHESCKKAKSVLAEQLMLERSGKSDPSRGILLELEMFRKDGSTIWVEMSASFLRDKNLNPNKILTVTRDITERKRAEEALANREIELSNLAESSPGLMGSFYLRPDGTICMPYSSPQIQNMFGLRSEDLVEDASALLARTHPDDAQRVIESIKESARTMTPWHCEYRVLHPTRGELWMEGSTNPRPHPNGGIIWYGFVHDITDRKRVEEAIKKSETQLNEAQRIAQIGSWELDIVNNILRWSDEIFRIFEIDPQKFDASYEAFLNAIHPDDRDIVNNAYTNSLKTLIPYTIDHRLLFEGGRIKYVHEQCETIFDESGKALLSTGTVQDITEHKLAEVALKESEEKYRTLIQKIQTAVIVHTPDTQILICNHTAEELLGLSEEQLLGKKAIDPDWHFYREDGTVLPIEEYPVNLVLASRSELRNYVVGIHRPNSDEDVWALVNADPVCGNENELTQVIVTFNDITKRKNAEVALKLSEVRYRTLVEHAMDGIFIADQSGSYIDVNQAGCQMLGYTRDQILKLNMIDLIRKEELQTAPIQFDKLRSGKTALAERNLIHSNGTLVPVEISGIMLPDKRFLGIVRNITERKKNEAALNERVKHSQSLLRLSKNLELAQTYSQVLNAALDEVKNILGYQSLWVYLLSEDKKYFKAIAAGGDVADVVMSPEGTAILTIAGDRMLEEIAEAKEIVIVEDAQTDERTNKKLVETLGNRTIINAPIYLFNKHLGTVGTGTFDSEGVRIPTQSELDYLLAMASHLAVTLDRIHLLNEREKTEHALLRLNRELKAISNCNQSLLRAEDEQSLLNEICNLICNEAGYKSAWVGYAENDTAKTIRTVAWAGFNNGYIADEKLSWSDETERGRGPAGVTIRTGEIVCVADFESDQLMAPWRESALQHGYHSGISLPLKDMNSLPFGALLIYSSERCVFTQDEIRLLEELASDLAFGIITIRTRAERKRVEKELELHRDHLQDLVNVRTE